MKNKSNNDRLIQIGEAAMILGFPVSTIRRWADRGRINGIIDPVGHRRFLEKYILELRNKILARTIRGGRKISN